MDNNGVSGKEPVASTSNTTGYRSFIMGDGPGASNGKCTVSNCYGIFSTGVVETRQTYVISNRGGSSFNNPPGLTFTEHDGTTLIPELLQKPWVSSTYTSLNTSPSLPGGTSWYSLTSVHLDYDDVNGLDLTQFLSDMNNVTSHVKGYMTIAAKADKARYVLLEFKLSTDNSTYATIDVGTVNVSSGSYSSSGDIFTNGEDCLIEFSKNGDRIILVTGFKGILATQDSRDLQVSRYTGYTGFELYWFRDFRLSWLQDFRGTLSWWNSFKLDYDNTSYSGTGISSGYWRPGDDLTTLKSTTYVFSEAANNYNLISLEGWVQLGILKKLTTNGQNTYVLLRDVTIDATKTRSLENWWDDVPNPWANENGYTPDGELVGVKTGTNVSWSSIHDYKRRYELEYWWEKYYNITYENHLYLKEGDVFDGNGHTILLNHDICYNEVTGVFPHMNSTTISQIWNTIDYIKWFIQSRRISLQCDNPIDGQYGNEPTNGDKTVGAWSKNPITIKNLKYGGTAPTHFIMEVFIGIHV